MHKCWALRSRCNRFFGDWDGSQDDLEHNPDVMELDVYMLLRADEVIQ